MLDKTSKVIEVFEYQLYGDYYCCKCGEPLFKCVSIGEAEDEDGNDWRSFCKNDYEELKASGMTDDEIYDNFETNKCQTPTQIVKSETAQKVGGKNHVG